MSNQMIAGYHDLWWAGAGTLASASVLLGSTGPDGLFTEETPHIEMITGDNLGPETEVDAVYRGNSLVLQFTLQEIKLDVAKKFLRPFTTSVSNAETGNEFGIPGILASAYSGYLTAIPRAGTPALTFKTGDNGRRFFGINIAPIRESLDTSPRFIPITFRAFPFDVGGTLSKWKWVAAGTTA